jgi:hypothetical protein
MQKKKKLSNAQSSRIPVTISRPRHKELVELKAYPEQSFDKLFREMAGVYRDFKSGKLVPAAGAS